jgi:hypothetical protein
MRFAILMLASTALATALGGCNIQSGSGVDPNEVVDGGAPPICTLGTKWSEVEANDSCKSTWTQQDSGSTFADSACGGVTSTLAISITGDEVSVIQTDSSSGNDCTYEGTISADCSSVSGSYTCSETGNSGDWSATIEGAEPVSSSSGSSSSGSSSGGGATAPTIIDSGSSGSAHADGSAGGSGAGTGH